MNGAKQAALITGASSGIGFALARMLGEEGYDLTLVARRPDKLEQAASDLAANGLEVQAVAANLTEEESIVAAVAAHRDHFGRLDVLVNNAGVGIGQRIGRLTTKNVQLQLAINLVAGMLFYREGLEMLKAAGAEHGRALIVNTASLVGKHGQDSLGAYSATKYGVVGFTEAMNEELNRDGVRSLALCPAFVDTAMTDFIKDRIPGEEMIQPEDCAELVRAVLKLSPACVVPELVITRRGDLHAL